MLALDGSLGGADAHGGEILRGGERLSVEAEEPEERRGRREAEVLLVEEEPAEKTDFWTFARDTRSNDPNWVLVTTASG